MQPVITALRHAPPLRQGLCAGRFDVPVQDLGSGLLTLAAELEARGLASVYTSPSSRCLRLASELAACLALPLRVDARLVELDFGQWEGQTWDAITRDDRARFEAWSRDWRVASPPGGECLNDIEARIRRFLDELGSEPALVVTHAGVIRAIWVLLNAVPWCDAMQRSVPYLEPLTF
jgi:alpha-ribazole phosphatase